MYQVIATRFLHIVGSKLSAQNYFSFREAIAKQYPTQYCTYTERLLTGTFAIYTKLRRQATDFAYLYFVPLSVKVTDVNPAVPI